MGKFALSDVLRNMIDSYKNFCNFFLGNNQNYPSIMRLVNITIITVIFINFLDCFWRLRGLNKIYWAGGAILMPVAFNTIELLKPAGNNCSILTTYSLVLTYILGLLFTGEWIEKNWKVRAREVCIAAALCIVIWNNYLLTNKVYMKLDLTWEKSKLWANNLLEKIQDVEGYSKTIPVMVEGLESLNSAYQDDSLLNELDSLLLTDSYTFCVDSNEYNENLLFHYYVNFLDVEITPVELDERNIIRRTETYKSMTYYPDDGSIEIINNVIIVKVGG